MSEEIEDNHGFKEEVEYAGFWIRLGASLIDMLVMIPIIAISMYNQFNIKSLALLFILTLISSLYKPLLEFKYGATLGKMACKIKVVNKDLKGITIDQSFIRYVPWGIIAMIQLMGATLVFKDPGFASADTFTALGEIGQNIPLAVISNYTWWVLFIIITITVVINKKKQGLHDKMAKTLCIKVKK